ncbi:hypothetical protein F7731_23640 [Cytobacillus depressus]|uniref:Uncharacterized protein n=1 Tax=Cytobacillus depressus TaxID=1602942 RepID=A0A6L3V4J3_9BACI|nr:hypothetical protein [Cytobacillus depressus]KAB2328949.1 hypothetical protein F7731_23640 [Cytobacillus depressus]
MNNVNQKNETVYRLYESDVIKLMVSVGIPVNSETLPRTKDYIADYLNQMMDEEVANYMNFIKAEITGKQED